MKQMKLILRSILIKEAEKLDMSAEDLFSQMIREDSEWYIVNDVWIAETL